VAEYDDLIAAGRERLRHWRIEDALVSLGEASRLCPQATAAHYLRGEAWFLQRQLDRALQCHEMALRCGMDHDIAARGHAMSGVIPGDFGWMCHMLQGDFESAWQLADRDRDLLSGRSMNAATLPRHNRAVWDGSALDGRRILVRCYHGLGDTIHFIRYMPLLAKRAASVCVEAQPELLDLFSGVPGIDTLCGLSDGRDRDCDELGCDSEIDVTELPYAFRTTLDTIPAAVPYLQAKPADLAAARRRLAALPGRRVGLCWAAGDWKPERSLTLGALTPLAAVPGVAFVSLQRGPAYESWRMMREGPPIAAELISDSVAETAATIAALDLVITVDTMVAHLGGALGVPVWLMLHAAADWRWLLDRSDSPWYPTMRLFRQSSRGDWGSVVDQISPQLKETISRRAVRGGARSFAAVPRRR
jgi:hypothetical protein